MDKMKLLWYAVFVLLIVVLVLFMMQLFTNHEYNKAKNEIKAAQEKIQNSIQKIDSAQSKINGLMEYIYANKLKLDSLNTEVYKMNTSMLHHLTQVTGRIKVLIDSVKKEQRNFKTLKSELEKLK